MGVEGKKFKGRKEGSGGGCFDFFVEGVTGRLSILAWSVERELVSQASALKRWPGAWWGLVASIPPRLLLFVFMTSGCKHFSTKY